MYATIFSIFSGASFFYFGYNYADFIKRLQTPVKQLKVPPNHSYFPQTVNQYTQLLKKKEENKYVIYSRYHKCPLSTHQLINQATIDEESKKMQIEKANIQGNNTANPEISTINSAQIQQKTEQKVQNNETKKRLLFERIYKDYARQLITNKVCTSVELIHGPIFSKDTPYKLDKEVVKNIYVSNIRVSKDGQWLTDRFYTVVVCNRSEGSYVNGFSHRKSNFPTFRLLNYLTSLKKLEQQTGLVFNVAGQQLTRIDYAGISKERPFETTQSARQDSKPTQEQSQ